MIKLFDSLVENGYIKTQTGIENCDVLYQKTIEKEPVNIIVFKYYKDSNNYEFTSIKDKEKYLIEKTIYGIKEDIDIKEIEKILGGENE